jgi:hypothetical protein
VHLHLFGVRQGIRVRTVFSVSGVRKNWRCFAFDISQLPLPLRPLAASIFLFETKPSWYTCLHCFVPQTLPHLRHGAIHHTTILRVLCRQRSEKHLHTIGFHSSLFTIRGIIWILSQPSSAPPLWKVDARVGDSCSFSFRHRQLYTFPPSSASPLWRVDAQAGEHFVCIFSFILVEYSLCLVKGLMDGL